MRPPTWSSPTTTSRRSWWRSRRAGASTTTSAASCATCSTTNSAEVWVMVLAPFLGLPIPLLPVQILWINLVTDGLPGLALSVEPAEPGVMDRPPRPPGESILAGGLWQQAVWLGLTMAHRHAGRPGAGARPGLGTGRPWCSRPSRCCSWATRWPTAPNGWSLFQLGWRSNRGAQRSPSSGTVAIQLAVVYLPVPPADLRDGAAGRSRSCSSWSRHRRSRSSPWRPRSGSVGDGTQHRCDRTATCPSAEPTPLAGHPQASPCASLLHR